MLCRASKSPRLSCCRNLPHVPCFLTIPPLIVVCIGAMTGLDILSPKSKVLVYARSRGHESLPFRRAGRRCAAGACRARPMAVFGCWSIASWTTASSCWIPRGGGKHSWNAGARHTVPVRAQGGSVDRHFTVFSSTRATHDRSLGEGNRHRRLRGASEEETGAVRKDGGHGFGPTW